MRLRCAFAVVAAAIFALAAANACSCEDPAPIDETFDGNVIIGDATPAPDAEPRDRGPIGDANDDAGDGDPRDLGPRDGDEENDGAPADGSDVDDAGNVCATLPERTLTANEAAAMAGALAGMIVEITGTATVTEQMCTDLACADGGTCCNTCTAKVSIDGVVPLLGSECFTPAPGCAGTECAQVCRPQVLGVAQSFRGRLVTPAGSVGLELFLVSP